MTREEALQILDTIPTIGEQVDALEMAIQALSQEPCDDAISREDAFEIIASNDTTDGTEPIFTGRQVVALLSTLPPVTQKSGKWILTIEDWNKWTCSNCGYVKRTDIHVNIGWKYCPNCGAKLESEE